MRKNLATHDPPGLNKPGQAVRALRNKLGLTLQEVSERTGLAVSTISKLEMGRASMSYEKLSLMSVGLGINMSELLGLLADSTETEAAPSVPGPGRRVVQRLGEGLVVQTDSYPQTFLAVELLNKQLVPLITEVRARSVQEFVAEFGGLIKHAGEEFTYVLEGEIEFHSEFYAPVRLKSGESVYIDSSMGHAYIAVSDGPCRVLCVCTGEADHVIGQFQKQE
ncbi:transcriptional regulator [Caballeronia udeis]|uniref:Transcriptional regulator n=2 Tax=Caballeronia udeis TaxID=1232866 RepID=A0A158ICU3_9BURK|nr:transcriptional regulator [Caballeronia udeis]